MSLFDEVSSLMFEAATLHRLVSVSDRGVDTFAAGTERLAPARFVRKDEVVYEDGGRQVKLQGELVAPITSGGIVGRRDKLVMDTGEVYRVQNVRRERDMSGEAYQAISVI